MGYRRSPLVRLAILYLLVGGIYVWVTPALEKPDEDGHYGYILYLREHRELPPLLFADGFPSEYKQPPLYYVVAAVLTAVLPDVPEPHDLLAVNPYMDFSVPGYREDNRNVFLHPPHMTPVILGARLVSLSLGLGTVIVAYYAARELFQGQPGVPTAVAAVVGFQPQFLFMATAVSNDVAIAFLGALIFAMLVLYMRRGSSARLVALLGVLLGLASITKVSGLVFMPLTALALLLIGRRPRHILRDGFIVVAVALAVGGWWYARNAIVYGDPLSIGTHTSSYGTPTPFSDRVWSDLSSLEHSFWANPSRTFVSQMWLDCVIVSWGRLSVLLAVLSLVLRRRSIPLRTPSLIVLLSWPIVFLSLLLTYWTRSASWAYGRLLFPAILPVGLFLVLGWTYAFPSAWRRILLPSAAGVVVIASALIPFVSVRPLYHPWRPWRDGSLDHPVGTTYVDPDTEEPVAQLIGYNLLRRSANPGEFCPVELCWRPLAQTETPYAIFLHFVDLSQMESHDSPAVLGSRRTYPGLGNLPTDRWVLDRPFCDRVLARLSPDLQIPLAAALEVGLLDPETGSRLRSTVSGGSPAGAVFLKGVSVVSPEEVQVGEQPLYYEVDEAFGLGQARLGGTVQGSVTLTLTWQSLHAVAYDATTFVHLRGHEDSLLAHVDRQPLRGRFPTSYWLPGQVVTDTVMLQVPPGALRGPLTLNLGMYTWPSLERLPIVNDQGIPQSHNMITIKVADLPDTELDILPGIWDDAGR